MRRILQLMSFSFLVLTFSISLVGCQADNEAGVATGGKGTVDPKYAKGDDASYEAYGKPDVTKNPAKPGAKRQ
jgi:hypothetical protein